MKLGEIFSQYPLFSELTSQELSELRMKAKDKTYEKGTILIRKDTPIKYVTIIISGSVKEQFKYENGKLDFYLIRSIGCVLDAYDFTYM
jgi:signal-transduction protein with cAMP-binding, CBS, and nucleotidyltransferase domain